MHVADVGGSKLVKISELSNMPSERLREWRFFPHPASNPPCTVRGGDFQLPVRDQKARIHLFLECVRPQRHHAVQTPQFSSIHRSHTDHSRLRWVQTGKSRIHRPIRRLIGWRGASRELDSNLEEFEAQYGSVPPFPDSNLTLARDSPPCSSSAEISPSLPDSPQNRRAI